MLCIMVGLLSSGAIAQDSSGSLPDSNEPYDEELYDEEFYNEGYGEDDYSDYTSGAYLSLSPSKSNALLFYLTVDIGDTGQVIDAESQTIAQDLAVAIGCSPNSGLSEMTDGWRWLTASCEHRLESMHERSTVKIDLQALRTHLTQLDVETLTISTSGLDSLPLTVTPSILESSPYWWTRNYSFSTIELNNLPADHLILTFGYQPFGIARRLGGAIALLLIPLVIVGFMRQRALQIETDDPSAIWFSYQRWLSWVASGTWMAWLALVISANLMEILLGLLPNVPIAEDWLVNVLFILPPIIINILCYALSHDVFVQIGQMDWTRAELMQQSLWGQLQILLPLMFAVAGLRSLFSFTENPHAMQWAVVWIILAVASRLILMQLVMRSQDLTAQSLTMGELRDRIFALAKPTGVKLNQVYVLPNRRNKMVNAFAMQGGNVVFTQFLLERLTKPEVDAVVAHELAHLQYKHHRSLQNTLVATAILVGIITSTLSILWLNWLPWIPITIVVTLLVFFYNSRCCEHQADIQAVLLTDNPAAMITALVKLAKLNLMPLDWGKREEWLLTHPSMRKRAKAIADGYDIPDEQLNQLMEASITSDNHYTLPDVVTDEQPVFSSMAKQGILSRISLVLLLVPTLLPVLLAWGINQLSVPAGVRWGLMTLGAIACLGAMLLALDWAPLLGNQSLRKKIRDRLQQHGFLVNDWQGTIVGLSPSSETRLYERFYNWDMGAVFLVGDRLCYVGEQTQFSLSASQITQIQRRSGGGGWWPMPRVGIYWQDDEREVGGAFTLSASNVQLLHQLAQTSRQLQRRIETWHDTAAPSEIPEPLAALPQPDFGNVTSQSLSELVTPTQTAGYILMLVIIALLFSMGTPLPWGFGSAGMAYVLVLVVLTSAIQFVPLWRDRV
jgi:STE24 endopeptidase